MKTKNTCGIAGAEIGWNAFSFSSKTRRCIGMEFGHDAKTFRLLGSLPAENAVSEREKFSEIASWMFSDETEEKEAESWFISECEKIKGWKRGKVEEA